MTDPGVFWNSHCMDLEVEYETWAEGQETGQEKGKWSCSRLNLASVYLNGG